MAPQGTQIAGDRAKPTITPAVLGLSIALAVATTAAVVLAIVHFNSPASPPAASAAGGTSGGVAPASSPTAGIQPIVQRETVQPRGETSGVVYFPQPFATPPHLKLTPGDRYLVAEVEEIGFTWVDRDRASTTELWRFFKDQADAVAKPKAPPSTTPSTTEAAPPVATAPPPQPELSWEAKGLPGDGRRRVKVELFEQSGSFASTFGAEGVIFFPIPFATPPNVQLSGSYSETTAVADCTTTNFRWKNGGKNQTWGQGSVTWTARGPKADGYPR